jgi:hypothetical protein
VLSVGQSHGRFSRGLDISPSPIQLPYLYNTRIAYILVYTGTCSSIISAAITGSRIIRGVPRLKLLFKFFQVSSVSNEDGFF